MVCLDNSQNGRSRQDPHPEHDAPPSAQTTDQEAPNPRAHAGNPPRRGGARRRTRISAGLHANHHDLHLYDRGIKIKDEEALSAIVAHLNKLEGVDLEPEFLAKSSSGPWEILVSADCAQQYKAKFKDQGIFAIHGVKYPMIVKFQTFDDKARELPQASSKSLASAFNIQGITTMRPSRKSRS